MCETHDLESWRRTLNLPKLPEEDMEKLNANPIIKELMACMVRRIVPVDAATNARRYLILGRLSNSLGAADSTSMSTIKQITNVKRRQMLENQLSIKHEEVSKYEKQVQDDKEKIKAMTKEMQKLSQNIKEKEKKCSFLALYKEKLLTKLGNQEFLLDFLKKTLDSYRQRRNIVGQLAEYPAEMDLKGTIKDCRSQLQICLNQMMALKSETSSKLPTGIKCSTEKSTELKRELISFIGNHLEPFPLTYILQHTLALQEEMCSEVHRLLSEKSSVSYEDSEDLFEAESLELISTCYLAMKADGKLTSWDERYEYIKGKYEETCAKCSESLEEYRKIQKNVDSEQSRMVKEILQLIALMPKCLEKFWDSHKRGAQLVIPLEALITCVTNLQSALPRELEVFTEIPLISVEYLSPLGMEKAESYKCLSQFERIPLHSMKFGAWAALLEESYDTRPHKLVQEVCQQLQYLIHLGRTIKSTKENREKMLQLSPSIWEEVSTVKSETETFKSQLLYLYNSFVDILAAHENNFYKLTETYCTIHPPILVNAIPRNYYFQEKSFEDWQRIVKYYCKRTN